MVWLSSCVTRRTTCTNVDSIQSTNYDDMLQSKSMHKLWISNFDIRCNNQPSVLPRRARSFVELLFKRYRRHRIKCTTIKFPANNMYEHGFHPFNAQVIKMICNNQNRCTSFDTIQQSTIHFAVPCRIVLLSKRCHRHRIKYTRNRLPLSGVVSRLLFCFGRTWIR